MADSTKVTFSEKSFAELVAAADPDPEDTTAYRFSNGKTFEAAGVYASDGK